VMCFGCNHALNVLTYVLNEVFDDQSDLINDRNELCAVRYASYLVFLIINKV